MKTLALALLLSLPVLADVATSGDKCTNKNCKTQSLTASSQLGIYLTNANPRICFNGACASFISFTGASNAVTVQVAGNVLGLFNGATGRLETNNFGNDTLNTKSSTYFQSVGASLTTGGACSPAGSLEYDTTGGCMKLCNAGLTWSACIATSSSSAIYAPWSSYCEKSPCTKAETAADAFLMPLIPAQANTTAGRITCNWRTAGSGGTTGVVAAIFNATDSTELCSCALGACGTASGVAVNCACGATMLSGKAYVLRLKNTTDCAVIPSLIGCTVSISE